VSIRSVARNFLIPLGIVFSIASPAFAQNATELNFEYFMNEVQPIFLAKRDGNVRCIQCHTRKSGFRLQPLEDGALFWTEEQSRMNYASARAFSMPGVDPLKSRLLTHPLATSAGGDPFTLEERISQIVMTPSGA
jgi:hypothetical protein